MGITYDRNQALTTITCVLAFLFFLPPAFGQEWTTYRSERDGFEAQFPGQPSVVETTWESVAGFTLPSRIHSLEVGPARYSVTVVDYTDIEALGREKLKACPPNLEICVGTPLSGEGYWKHDLRGTMLWAASMLIKRDVKVTDMSWNQISRISTILLSLTNNSDESTTYAVVTMNERMLYIVEATVPKGAPSAVRFGGTFGMISRSTGRSAVYPSLYSNEIYGVGDIPPPPPAEGTEGGATPFSPFDPDQVD